MSALCRSNDYWQVALRCREVANNSRQFRLNASFVAVGMRTDALNDLSHEMTKVIAIEHETGLHYIDMKKSM
jgi:hypothetical protein